MIPAPSPGKGSRLLKFAASRGVLHRFSDCSIQKQLAKNSSLPRAGSPCDGGIATAQVSFPRFFVFQSVNMLPVSAAVEASIVACTEPVFDRQELNVGAYGYKDL